MAQHVVVTLTALGAAGVLLREMAAFLWPKKNAPGCGQCASGRERSTKRAPTGTGEGVVLQIQGRRRG